jgi:putative phosphoribosyl transferase
MGAEAEGNILPFRDRAEAGRLLGSALAVYARRKDVVVLGLPRGGVAVACQVSKALAAPLDVLVVRKVGAPGNPELAIGAVAPGGVCILQEPIITALELDPATVTALAAGEEEALRRGQEFYRRNLPPQRIEGATAILVDDGIATGATMLAAVAALRRQEAKAIVVAAPVAPAAVCRELQSQADHVVCLATPDVFFTVGQWYVDFEQVSDQEMAALLEQASTFA